MSTMAMTGLESGVSVIRRIAVLDAADADDFVSRGIRGTDDIATAPDGRSLDASRSAWIAQPRSWSRRSVRARRSQLQSCDAREAGGAR